MWPHFILIVTRISVSGNVADSVKLNQIKMHAEATIVNAEQVEKK